MNKIPKSRSEWAEINIGILSESQYELSELIDEQPNPFQKMDVETTTKYRIYDSKFDYSFIVRAFPDDPEKIEIEIPIQHEPIKISGRWVRKQYQNRPCRIVQIMEYELNEIQRFIAINLNRGLIISRTNVPPRIRIECGNYSVADAFRDHNKICNPWEKKSDSEIDRMIYIYGMDKENHHITLDIPSILPSETSIEFLDKIIELVRRNRGTHFKFVWPPSLVETEFMEIGG